MQTFLPEPSFIESAWALDRKRLLKQIVEGNQILDTLIHNKKAWSNHPAVKMWRGYESALALYVWSCIVVADMHGYKVDKTGARWIQLNLELSFDPTMTDWWSDDRVFITHKHNLYLKDPEYYRGYEQEECPTCCERCKYFWPTHTKEYA